MYFILFFAMLFHPPVGTPEPYVNVHHRAPVGRPLPCLCAKFRP